MQQTQHSQTRPSHASRSGDSVRGLEAQLERSCTRGLLSRRRASRCHWRLQERHRWFPTYIRRDLHQVRCLGRRCERSSPPVYSSFCQCRRSTPSCRLRTISMYRVVDMDHSIPLASRSSLSKRWNKIADGWWMVHRTACPLCESFVKRSQIDHEVWLSRPDVGSSKKSNNAGLAASSTPMVRRFRCSTFRPSPGIPTIASAQDCISSIVMTSSTYASFSALL